MNPLSIINKYYPEDNTLRRMLMVHSRAVADKAMCIAAAHPELNLDVPFVEEASLLHDIGIFMTDAEGIHCRGTHHYLCHGWLGAELLRKEGFPRHALVCERHTGTGLTKEQILENGWQLPPHDMQPVTMEEQVICFADKFFSKTHLDEEKSIAQARHSLEKFGEAGLAKFDRWCDLFL